ncbi:flippase [Sulfurimonas sp.]|uniref:flippase n=1 Tax=Sulfurimonas sp. TaxID=2022749 RepID=UPI002B4AA397|nr:flippase [Sulfurimonas sp.]
MKYFKNTSWLFGEKILRMVVGLFVGIWVARYLGPEQFGLFSYAQSFVGLFAAIATLGLDGIVVRELVKDESKRDELIGTAFWLKAVGAFVVLLILAIAINFTSNDTYTNTLVFIIASATIFQSFNVVDFYFQSKVMSKYAVYANIISLFMSSIVKVALLLNEAPLIAFAWVILFDSFVLAMGFIYFYIKNNSSVFKWKFDKIVAVSLLKDSWPLMFTVVMVMVYLNVIPILLKYYLHDLTLIGHYQVALRITILIDFIPVILVNSIFPYLVQSSSDTKRYLKNLQIISNYFNVIVLLYSIMLILFSKEIILLLYGKDYLYSAELFKYMVLLNFFSFHGYLSGRYYIIAKLEKQYLLRVILGLLVLLMSSAYLIPKYQVEGAIISLLLSELMVVFISDIFYLNKTKDILMIKLKSLYLFVNYKSYVRNNK